MSDPIAPSPAGDRSANLPASIEFRPRGDILVDPVGWAAGATTVRAGLAAEGLPASGMVEALNAFRFLDAAGATWTYNGSDWSSWNGTTWVTSAPPATLKLQPFSMDLVPDAPDSVPALVSAGPAAETPVVQDAPVAQAAPVVQPAPVPAPMPAPAQAAPMPPTYWPSHVAPHTGLPAWSQPDPRLNAVTSLAPGLDVMVVEWLPTGWAHIVCSNQWSGWVDGRQLVPLNQQPMGYRR